jgi:hypothetical protein
MRNWPEGAEADLELRSMMTRIGGGIFKLIMSPGFDSKESIPPAYVARRAGTTTLFLLDS